MSDRLGAVTFEKERRPLFLETMVPPSRDYSEGTAQAIDQEVALLIEEAAKRAEKTLLGKREKLETLAKRLLEVEVVEKEELYRIFAEDRKEENPKK